MPRRDSSSFEVLACEVSSAEAAVFKAYALQDGFSRSRLLRAVVQQYISTRATKTALNPTNKGVQP